MWTGNNELDRLRSKAAASDTGCISVSIDELNAVLPIGADNHIRVVLDFIPVTERLPEGELPVAGLISLRHGWPKCCGYTMTIDSPEDQARLAKEA